MRAPPRLYYLDDIPTPYRVGVQRRIASDWPGEFRVGFCAESEPGREWTIDYGDLKPDFLDGKQWRPRGQVNPFSFKWNPGVTATLAAFRPDVVVLSGYIHPTMWAAAWWCLRNKVPYAIVSETSARNSATSGWRWLVKRALTSWIVRKMAFGLPVGREAGAYFVRYGPTDAPMHFFPNTPDTSGIVAEARRIAETHGEGPLRAELGIPADAPILLFVGRLIDAKRPSDAIRAFRLADTEGKAAMVIVGDGDQMAALREAADGDPRIIFTGWLKEPTLIAGMMSIATGMILPSSHEPWGAVVNEAMAAGTPVISSDRVGAAIELIENGENGYLVPVGDVVGYADAIRKLITDAELAHGLGVAAQQTAIAQGESFAADNLISGALEATKRQKGGIP